MALRPGNYMYMLPTNMRAEALPSIPMMQSFLQILPATSKLEQTIV